jgi:putative intracellular protease/amidase
VLEDGKLVTGQNPASSEGVARALLAQVAPLENAVSDTAAR